MATFNLDMPIQVNQDTPTSNGTTAPKGQPLVCRFQVTASTPQNAVAALAAYLTAAAITGS